MEKTVLSVHTDTVPTETKLEPNSFLLQQQQQQQQTQELQKKSKYISERRQFHRFPNKVLVESGSHYGNGIQDALDAGFSTIISFECVPELAEKCRKRFEGNDKVVIINDSSRNMFKYICNIKEPITFWLDAHWSQEDTGHDGAYCPILFEIEAIAKHPIKTHTILIDDKRLFGTWEFLHIPIQQVIDKVLDINPEYNIQFLDGHIKRDIVAFHI